MDSPVSFGDSSSSSPAEAKILYATTEADSPNAKTVASVTLAPQSSTTVQLSDLAGNPQMRNSFIVQSSVTRGSLAVDLTAVGGPLFRTVQLIGKDQQQTQNGGRTLGRSKTPQLRLYCSSIRARPTTVSMSESLPTASYGSAVIGSKRSRQRPSASARLSQMVLKVTMVKSCQRMRRLAR